MKRRHTTPRYYARNAAMQAQRRFLRTGKTEAERLDDHREETGNVLVLCILAAIYDKYGIGEMRLQRVVDCANEISAKFSLEKQVRGEERAKATLEAAVWWFMPPFLLPALSAPKTEREAVQLAARREAADTVMKIYVQAMHKALGFGADRVAVVAAETEGNFRQFGECTKDGEYYSHLHISAGDESGRVFGGHLNEAHISATAEVVIRMINGEVDRFYDDATGLNLFKF